MSEFKRWISYIFSYDLGGRRKNVGFAKVDARDGKCRLQVCVRGIGGRDGQRIEVGIYVWEAGRPTRYPAGKLYLRGGAGEYLAATKTENLFDSGFRLEESGGLWLTGPEPAGLYLAAWNREELDARDFLTQAPPKKLVVSAAALETEEAGAGIRERVPGKADMAPPPASQACARRPKTAGGRQPGLQAQACTLQPELAEPGNLQVIDVARLPEPDLWESLCRYYPKAAPELRARGVELLQIRPADIRYLPRRLWHFGSNSFLLHGYYHYKHLILGRMYRGGKKEYILGVRGRKEKRESFSAGLFGFEDFLALGGDSREGYWYVPVTLEPER